jgi:hypothetical protein
VNTTKILLDYVTNEYKTADFAYASQTLLYEMFKYISFIKEKELSLDIKLPYAIANMMICMKPVPVGIL